MYTMCNLTTFALRHMQISLSSILRHSRPPSRHLLLYTHDTNMEFLQLSGPLLDIFLFFSKTKIFHSHPCMCAQLLGWLTEKLPTHKMLPPELRDCVAPLLTCLEDRSGDVRKKAQDAIVPFMIHIGYNNFVKATGKLKVCRLLRVLGSREILGRNGVYVCVCKRKTWRG